MINIGWIIFGIIIFGILVYPHVKDFIKDAKRRKEE